MAEEFQGRLRIAKLSIEEVENNGKKEKKVTITVIPHEPEEDDEEATPEE